MITPILFLAGLAALPATGNSARMEIDATVFFGGRHFEIPPSLGPLGFVPSSSGYDVRGGGSGGITIFAPRVVDDGDVPSLQPFLQRVFRFHLEVGGDGRSLRGGVYPTNYQDGSLDTWADGYVGRYVHLAGGFTLDYYSVDRAQFSELVLQPWAEFGVRFRDFLISAGWSIYPYQIEQRSFRVDFWGGAYASFYGVIARWIELGAGVTVLDQGALARLGLTFWFRRRLGLSFGVTGGRGAYLDESSNPSQPFYSRAGTSVGVRIWDASSFSLFAGYSFHWQSSDIPNTSNDGYLHLLTVSGSLRPH